MGERKLGRYCKQAARWFLPEMWKKWWRKKKKLSAMYLAKEELTRIENTFASEKNKSKLIKELSELIRRVTISVFHRNESASLTGEEWLLFLDKINGDDSFSKGAGRVLIEAPYQSSPDYDEQALLQLIKRWIESVNSTSGKVASIKTGEKA